jgi:hypothetical protein
LKNISSWDIGERQLYVKFDQRNAKDTDGEVEDDEDDDEDEEEMMDEDNRSGEDDEDEEDIGSRKKRSKLRQYKLKCN